MLTRYRHELGSLFDVECEPEFQKLSEASKEIVRHVIAAHHGRKIAIDLDRSNLAGTLDQYARQRRPARPDLDDGLPGTRIDHIDDSRDHSVIVQKILAEALARPMRCALRLSRRNVYAPGRYVPAPHGGTR